MPRQPRIAVGASVLRGLRIWAAREGKDPCDLATQILRDALPPEIRSLAGLEPPKSSLQHSEAQQSPNCKPTTPQKPSIAADTHPSRTRRGGKVPYEDLHPEIAARVLDLWGGGKHKGGMSRTEIAELLQSEGIPMTAAIVYKIVSRAQQKRNI